MIRTRSQNCLFKLKFDAKTDSNVLNLMVMFTFSVLDGRDIFFRFSCKDLKAVTFQGCSQNLKEVPQNFTGVLNIHDSTANDVIHRNQHRKEEKNEFHSNH